MATSDLIQIFMLAVVIGQLWLGIRVYVSQSRASLAQIEISNLEIMADHERRKNKQLLSMSPKFSPITKRFEIRLIKNFPMMGS